MPHALRQPPAWFRQAETRILLRTFARAFGTKAPRLGGASAEGALAAFCSFTASSMEQVLGPHDRRSEEGRRRAAGPRARLARAAHALGARLRMVPGVSSHAPAVARYLYRGIGIELDGELPGDLRFGPCSFATRYTPDDCWLMSAFDEGFMRGLTGCDEATLAFSCRLTEGATCCRARFQSSEPSHSKPS